MTASPERTELDQLKASVDLVALVRDSGVELKKSGKSYLGRCPFHDDDTPSLSVNQDERLWNCFGCSAGGDALAFLQLKEKLEFPQAVERLKQLTRAPGPNRQALLARLAELYQKRLLEQEPAQSYLKSRGLEPETWKAFRVGFCDGTVLGALPTDVLEQLREMGVVTREGKEHFRGCVVVPLTHPDRGVVGFYGRRIRPDAKVRHLYLPGPRQGVLNWQAMKASTTITIAESVLDAMSLWQAGIKESTCVLGVEGLTSDFQGLVTRFGVEEVTLCLDGDRPGLEATLKFSQTFAGMGLRVSSVRMPDDTNPNCVLVADGPARLAELLRMKQAVGSPAPAASPVQAEPTVDGFALEIAGVSYHVQPMPPFATRLRINLRAHQGERWLQDRFDLYVQRDRTKLVTQIATQLGVSRLEAERHQLALFKECDTWASAQKIKAQAADKPAPPEMSEGERLEALRFLRQPKLRSRSWRIWRSWDTSARRTPNCWPT